MDVGTVAEPSSASLLFSMKKECMGCRENQFYEVLEQKKPAVYFADLAWWHRSCLKKCFKLLVTRLATPSGTCPRQIIIKIGAQSDEKRFLRHQNIISKQKFALREFPNSESVQLEYNQKSVKNVRVLELTLILNRRKVLLQTTQLDAQAVSKLQLISYIQTH